MTRLLLCGPNASAKRPLQFINEVELFHAARMPQPEPVTPLDAETQEKIGELYSQAATYFDE